MTVGNILVRNHNALAKACLGGGFAFGFAYTNNHGTNPIRDAATAAGTRARPRDPPLFIRASPNATGRSRPSPRADTRRGASRRAFRARLRRGALPRPALASDRDALFSSFSRERAGIENANQQTTFTVRTPRSDLG